MASFCFMCMIGCLLKQLRWPESIYMHVGYVFDLHFQSSIIVYYGCQKSQKSVEYFILKNANKKRNQHACKQVRATLRFVYRKYGKKHLVLMQVSGFEANKIIWVIVQRTPLAYSSSNQQICLIIVLAGDVTSCMPSCFGMSSVRSKTLPLLQFCFSSQSHENLRCSNGIQFEPLLSSHLQGTGKWLLNTGWPLKRFVINQHNYVEIIVRWEQRYLSTISHHLLSQTEFPFITFLKSSQTKRRQ